MLATVSAAPDTSSDPGAGPLRLAVSGDLDEVSAQPLLQSMIDMLRRHLPGAIEVDVSGVTSLDPAGIAALLDCQADARQLECRLTLCGPRPEVYRLLQIAGLLEQFGLTRARACGPVPASAGAALGLVNSGLGG